MVLFPNKLQKLSPVVMNQYLDTLVSQVHTDNTNIITSLETVFNSYVGNVYTHVDKRFKYHFGNYTDTYNSGNRSKHTESRKGSPSTGRPNA
jgi:hypothetical protein